MTPRRKIWSYVLPPAIALGVVVLLRLWVFAVVKVHSSALAPELMPGAVAFVFRPAEPAVGRAVLFHFGRSHSDQGQALGRIRELSVDSLGTPSYWVLADDTLQHPDSRDLGWIARPSIVGTVVYHINF